MLLTIYSFFFSMSRLHCEFYPILNIAFVFHFIEGIYKQISCYAKKQIFRIFHKISALLTISYFSLLHSAVLLAKVHNLILSYVSPPLT